MGDRTSIQFKNKNDLSPILYGQRAGMLVVYMAEEFLELLKQEHPERSNGSTPISRREPSALLPMFISIYVNPPDEKGYWRSWRLYDSTLKMGGNDNGHWIVDCEQMKVIKEYD
jgi:hypothetical protein